MLQFTRQLERAQVAQLQLKQDLANQQVQAQLRIAQVGETAHRDIAQLTQSNDMLTGASTHLMSHVRQALDTAEGMAGITPPHLGLVLRCMCVCLCVCVCMRACVRACVYNIYIKSKFFPACIVKHRG